MLTLTPFSPLPTIQWILFFLPQKNPSFLFSSPTSTFTLWIVAVWLLRPGRLTVCLCSWHFLFGVQLFCDPMDYSPPGSSVHEISQARILEWVTISFSRGSSRPKDWTCISCTGRRILYHWATREALHTLDRSLVIAKPPCLLPLRHFSAVVFFLKHD